MEVTITSHMLTGFMLRAIALEMKSIDYIIPYNRRHYIRKDSDIYLELVKTFKMQLPDLVYIRFTDDALVKLIREILTEHRQEFSPSVKRSLMKAVNIENLYECSDMFISYIEYVRRLYRKAAFDSTLID